MVVTPRTDHEEGNALTGEFTAEPLVVVDVPRQHRIRDPFGLITGLLEDRREVRAPGMRAKGGIDRMMNRHEERLL
jgi:hypothetical protein